MPARSASPDHAAFLRGINLGNRRPKMAELRDHFEAMGFDDVATFLASGNVLFHHDGSDRAALEAEIESNLEAALGYDVATFVRPLPELATLVERDVVTGATEEGFTPHVVFLRQPPEADARESLRGLETPDDRFPVLGHEVLWLRRGRMTDSTIKNRDIERALGGADNTMRNVNTIRRIVEKFGPG